MADVPTPSDAHVSWPTHADDALAEAERRLTAADPRAPLRTQVAELEAVHRALTDALSRTEA